MKQRIGFDHFPIIFEEFSDIQYDYYDLCGMSWIVFVVAISWPVKMHMQEPVR